jgi:ABC-type branched-subunit amino acid transport system permease subunit
MVNLGVALWTAIGAVALAAMLSINTNQSSEEYTATLVISFFVAFVLGYVIAVPIFSVVSSAINSVIVLYAEAPGEFQANHPKLASDMLQSWRQAYPSEFRY